MLVNRTSTLNQNSNVSIAIAVSCNAMPDQLDVTHVHTRLGKIFIAIAGYVEDNQMVPRV